MFLFSDIRFIIHFLCLQLPKERSTRSRLHVGHSEPAGGAAVAHAGSRSWPTTPQLAHPKPSALQIARQGRYHFSNQHVWRSATDQGHPSKPHRVLCKSGHRLPILPGQFDAWPQSGQLPGAHWRRQLPAHEWIQRPSRHVGCRRTSRRCRPGSTSATSCCSGGEHNAFGGAV